MTNTASYLPPSLTPERWQDIGSRYPRLSIAVLGDFCLDRYLDIDPQRNEISIETGLPVYNVVRVRGQPGAAGTILCNLVALGIGQVLPIGFAGVDGEGFELVRALRLMPGVRLNGFMETPLRSTQTYCKPMVIEADRPPRELNRLDRKNWTPTPPEVEDRLIASLNSIAEQVDALIVMDQVDHPETGVVTSRVLEALAAIAKRRPTLPILADSRRTLRGFPDVDLKMNRSELSRFLDDESIAQSALPDIPAVMQAAATLARIKQRNVIITLAEHGLVGATRDGQTTHFSALPILSEIDIVGAGDAVSANLSAALAAGATLSESLSLANAAANVVIHQLGTTGTASQSQIAHALELIG